jgi:hypothetical protein
LHVPSTYWGKASELEPEMFIVGWSNLEKPKLEYLDSIARWMGAVLVPHWHHSHLYHYPEDYKPCFTASVCSSVYLRLRLWKRHERLDCWKQKTDFIFSFLNYWKQSPSALKLVVDHYYTSIVLPFLLLKAKDAGLDTST